MFNPYEIVAKFEESVAEYAGCSHGIAVESCSAALFLCCVYCKVQEVVLPKHTYVSVPCEVIHAGGNVRFEDAYWEGSYQLKPYPIWDSAARFCRDMYRSEFYCVSFHAKKHIDIGRGGMILTNNKDAYEWFRQARWSGRHWGVPLIEDNTNVIGWDVYMTPEQAARGMTLMQFVQDVNPDLHDIYPDISKFKAFQ